MKRCVALMLLTAMTCSSTLCAEDGQIVVVVGAKSSIGQLSAEEISKLFTGKLEIYPDGALATPVNLPESSEIRTEFALKVLKKTPVQLHAYWSKLLFTGRGKPPIEVASPGEMKNTLASDPSAIGYLDKADVDKSIKVVYGF